MEIYGNMIFSKRHELDKLAYAKYYDEHYFSDFESDPNGELLAEFLWDKDNRQLTFNQFYGTETHKRYLLPLLRKLKLEKINQIK